MSAIALSAAAAVFLAQGPVLDPFRGMPGVEAEVPIAGELEALGRPLHARMWRVRMPPQQALQWVFEAYKRADLFVPPASKQFQLEGAHQLTAYDHPNRRSYTAIFKDGGRGMTLLICATAYLGDLGQARRTATLPALPGAFGTLEVRDEGATTLSYGVRATAAEVDDYYRQVLPSVGWRLLPEGDGWARPGELLTVEHALREEGVEGVLVTLRRSAPRPGEARQ